MVPHLAMLALLGAVLAAAIIGYTFLRQKKMLKRYVFVGLVVACLDFAIELIGTHTGSWTYHESFYHILGKIPMELPIMFFSGGIIAAFIYTQTRNVSIPIKPNTILYAMMCAGALLYLAKMPLYGSVAVGIWGILNIKKESHRTNALVLAILVGVLDAIVEILIIGRGGYSYTNGFASSIPLTYGLLTLGLLGLMEKLNHLDSFFANPVVKYILKMVRIKK